MQFLLTLVEDDECAFFEVLKEALLHDVGDFIEEASEIAMTVVVIQDPAQSLVDPEDEVVQVVLVARVVDVQLFADLSEEGGVVEQVVEGVGNLFDVEVDVALVVFVAGRVHDVVPAFSLLAQDYYQSIQVFY